jgi:type VI protein secretion system component VasK
MLKRRVFEVGDTLVASRILGVLLCVAAVVVIILHIYFGYINGSRPGLAFALPVTAGLLVVCGLGFWLGWIMAATREVSPSPLSAKSEEKERDQSAPEK